MCKLDFRGDLSIAFACVVLVAGVVDLSAQTNAFPAKPKIGIMKFEVASDLKPSLGQFLYSTLMEQMVASKRFTVVDWEEIDRLLGYMAKAQPNLAPDEARKQAIHQLGLEKMYLGSVSRVGSRFHVTVKLLNLDLSVERAERLSAASEDELEAAVTGLAKLLVATADEAGEIRAAMERQQAEHVRWTEIQKDATEEDLKAFLKEFPDGALASKATAQMEETRARRLAKEAEQKTKEEAQKAAEQKAAEMEVKRRNLTGEWTIQLAGGRASRRAQISQETESVTLFVWDIFKHKYSGTCVDGKLNVTSGSVTLRGAVSEDGETIIGQQDGSNGHYDVRLSRKH